MPEWVVEFPERLDKFLAEQMPEHSRSRIAKWIEESGVTVDGQSRPAGFKLRAGMRVSTDEIPEQDPHDLTPTTDPIEVLFEDEELLVVNKPRGMATHPAPGLRESTLVNALLGRGSNLSAGSAEYRPGIVHRLDKETTGLLMVARTDAAHRSLAAQISSKTAERRYIAICAGAFPEARLRIDAPIDRDKRDRRKMAVSPEGKSSLTHIKRLQLLGDRTLVAARLSTGRTHQIRVHLMAAGYPVVGDEVYASGGLADGPLQLHAAYLEFSHPISDERMAFFLPPPADFAHWDPGYESELRNW